MTNPRLPALLVCLCGVLCDSLPATAQDAWQTLFNGRDLTGWRANLHPTSARVEDGAIRLQSVQDRVHLFYIGDGSGEFVRFKNFELKLRARGELGSNSGIFFHTDFTVRDQRQHLAKGYEVQLNSNERERRKTGSLYAGADLAASPVDESQWFDVHLIVDGRQITIKLNGETVVEYTEPPNPDRPPNRSGRLLDPNGGAIALQAHDPDSVFYFKDIRVKRLPDAQPTDSAYQHFLFRKPDHVHEMLNLERILEGDCRRNFPAGLLFNAAPSGDHMSAAPGLAGVSRRKRDGGIPRSRLNARLKANSDS